MPAYYKEGRYSALVVNQALGKNGKGTPQFVLRCKILHQIVDGQIESVRQQYERTIYMYLSDGAAPYTLKKIQELGFTGNSFRQLDLSHPQVHSFCGQEIELDCRWEDYQGEDVEKWDVAYSGSAEITDITPLDASETRKLDAMFGKSLGGTKAPVAAKPAARAQTRTAVAEPPERDPEDPGITDDDIPF